jgi:DNA modification methylase
VDLIVTSPPYFGLRSYTDGGEHYQGQVGDEATPSEYLDALGACTAEWLRVLKSSGSLWVNLGDKYARNGGGGAGSSDGTTGRGPRPSSAAQGAPEKSLIGLPWRYALRCIDELGLILRAEVIWSKPNGLPESVTDRVRRSHEQWFHFTKEPRYFSAVDEVREPHAAATLKRYEAPFSADSTSSGKHRSQGSPDYSGTLTANPLGKLPGSVWTVPTEPLKVPEHLGVDHFAAFPTEWPRRIILGWSPAGICVACGEGRRPVVVVPSPVGHVKECAHDDIDAGARTVSATSQLRLSGGPKQKFRAAHPAQITGYACDCDEPTAPTRPAVVLDPFGGTGTTALVASALGRTGISVDLSHDYCRLARWRTTDPGERAKALRVEKPPVQIVGQGDLFGDAA